MLENTTPKSVLLLGNIDGVEGVLDRWDRKHKNEHFRLERAERLEDGFERHNSGQPDVVLLDLNLPDNRGLDALHRVRIQWPAVPVVVLSGSVDQSIGSQAVREGAQDYITLEEINAGELVRSLLYAIERNDRRLAEQQLRLVRHEEELARDVQLQLLPRQAPQLSGFEFAMAYRPADLVGGDYFDFIPLEHDKLGIIMADVSGHGLGPGILMAGTRRLLRSCFEHHEDLGEILTHANEGIWEDAGGMRFVTMFVCRIAASTRSLDFAAAGHDGLLLDREGRCRRLTSRDVPLGIDGQICYESYGPVEMRPGELLVLCTDGLFEVQDCKQRDLGIDRLMQFVHRVREHPAQRIANLMVEYACRYTKPAVPKDDMAVVIAKAESD